MQKFFYRGEQVEGYLYGFHDNGCRGITIFCEPNRKDHNATLMVNDIAPNEVAVHSPDAYQLLIDMGAIQPTDRIVVCKSMDNQVCRVGVIPSR